MMGVENQLSGVACPPHLHYRIHELTLTHMNMYVYTYTHAHKTFSRQCIHMGKNPKTQRSHRVPLPFFASEIHFNQSYHFLVYVKYVLHIFLFPTQYILEIFPDWLCKAFSFFLIIWFSIFSNGLFHGYQMIVSIKKYRQFPVHANVAARQILIGERLT